MLKFLSEHHTPARPERGNLVPREGKRGEDEEEDGQVLCRPGGPFGSGRLHGDVSGRKAEVVVEEVLRFQARSQDRRLL